MNCFQKLLSSWHDTTLCWISQLLFVLWIAFKNYYLRDTTQPTHPVILELNCCELLSKIIIFVTRHNSNNFRRILCLVVNCFQKLLSSWHDTTFGVLYASTKGVVNCFQKLLSSWHDTTVHIIAQKNNKLWIAFKNYYLRDTTQPSHIPG